MQALLAAVDLAAIPISYFLGEKKYHGHGGLTAALAMTFVIAGIALFLFGAGSLPGRA